MHFFKEDNFSKTHARRLRALSSFRPSFEKARCSFAAERNPNVEHMIVVDWSRGFIRTTVAEARIYAELGYVVLDLCGYNVEWDSLRTVPIMEEFEREPFNAQMVEVWDVEDAFEGVTGAQLDEEIYYDTVERRLKRRKVTKVKALELGPEGGKLVIQR
ncbi:hypothetical protein N0V90_000997 [Kalmusia sp. IMI 367209]|nr:hypothetical protein N0V90_000997 [Kalmusia sp. IMI 367209]